MTVVEQVPFEAIDNEDAPTPAWESYRKQRGETQGDHKIPRGTYEATLIEATVVRRKDGGYVIRMVARTDNLGRYVLAWRGLSTDGVDPYDLTEVEVKSLRRFAASMGIPVPAPARQIVEALQALVGGPVMARVVHTPVGTQTTLYRDTEAAPVTPSTFRVAGQVVAVDGHVLDGDGELLEGAAADAFRAHSHVLEGQQLMRRAVGVGAHGCYELRRSEGWLALGFATLSEYLAQPEVEISRSEFQRLAHIYEVYVLSGGIELVALEGAGSSKLEIPIPAIEQGMVSAEQAASDAESLTRNDLRDRYRALLGTVDEPEGEPEPVAKGPGKRERQALDLIRQQPGVTIPELAGAMQVQQNMLYRILPELARDGEIVREGRGWRIRTDDDVEPDQSHRRDEVDDDGELCGSDMVRADGTLVDADELVAWAENYGHPEAWAKKAQDLHAKNETLLAENHRLKHDHPLVPLDVSRSVTSVLRRVLVEIGDPKQKRMGKELRAAVLAALDEAREHGLDAEGQG